MTATLLLGLCFLCFLALYTLPCMVGGTLAASWHAATALAAAGAAVPHLLPQPQRQGSQLALALPPHQLQLAQLGGVCWCLAPPLVLLGNGKSGGGGGGGGGGAAIALPAALALLFGCATGCSGGRAHPRGKAAAGGLGHACWPWRKFGTPFSTLPVIAPKILDKQTWSGAAAVSFIMLRALRWR